MSSENVPFSVFDIMARYGHEEVLFCRDPAAGLRAIIAIHDTTLGPAAGGTRLWTYASELEALEDALRLSRGMTYKYAAAGRNLGGGKGVIMVNSMDDKCEKLLRAFGRFVDSLGGRFITGKDVGITVEDLETMNMETDYVIGLPVEKGGSGGPSPYTAIGVLQGMKACLRHLYGDEGLEGRRVAVQGVGNVGYSLVKHLAEEKADIIVTDIERKKVEKVAKEFGASSTEPEEIFGVECDIFAPCALGAVINDQTIPRLKCKIIAGAANNQLHEDRHGDMLEARGILYAPDYIINAGGTIADTDQLEGGFNRERALRKVHAIYDNLLKVFSIARRDELPTYRAADRMAEERIRSIGGLKRMGVGCGHLPER